MTIRLIDSAAITIGVLIAAAAPVGAQGSAEARTSPVPVASLAGQPVAVLPLTLVVADSTLRRDTSHIVYADRARALAWADSVIGTGLTGRAPEAQWILPPALRKIARRSPGMVKNPDELGQAALRSPRLTETPEPLRAELRKLVAVAGGRRVLVPAALGFTHDTAAASPGVRADLSLVLVDARAGTVLWRTVAAGRGRTPADALDAALVAALPVDIPAP